jgi:hypothetical protein
MNRAIAAPQTDIFHATLSFLADSIVSKEGVPMKRMIAAVLVACLASSAYGAVGDLTSKGCDPNVSGSVVAMSVARILKPAPAGCGTVNPAAQVVTLRSGGSEVMVAVDSANASDKDLNVLRIDATGDGKFTPAATLPIKWAAEEGTSSNVGPGTVRLTRGGRQVPVEVSGYLVRSSAGIQVIYLRFGACMEGQCAFGEKVHTVRFIDMTCNFRADDPTKVIMKDGAPTGVTTGDALWIEQGAGGGPAVPPTEQVRVLGGEVLASGGFSLAGEVGQPIMVDGVWYDLTLSADGTKVAAAPLKGPFGKVKVDADQWSATLVGERVFNLTNLKGAIEVPAGKYAVLSGTMMKAGAGATFADTRLRAGMLATMFEVAAGKTAENVFGPPLSASVAFQGKDRAVTFTPAITDAGGRTVSSFYSAGTTPATIGKFEVCGADGKTVYSAALEFS